MPTDIAQVSATIDWEAISMHKHSNWTRLPLTASLAALLVASPVVAQAPQDNQATGQTDGQTAPAEGASPGGTGAGTAATGGTAAGDAATGGTATGDTAAGAAATGGDAPAGAQAGDEGAQAGAPTAQAGQQDDDAMDGSMPEAAQNLDAMTEPGPPGMQGGGAMMLDMEQFAQDIYERGFRQGYVRGAIEARMRLADQMRSAGGMGAAGGTMGQTPAEGAGGLGAAAGAGQAQQQGQAGQPGDPMARGGMPSSGAVIVLPPGMTPDMVIQMLQQRP